MISQYHYGNGTYNNRVVRQVNDISGDVYNLTSHVSVLDENQTVIKESLEEHAAIMIGQKQFAKETYSDLLTLGCYK